MMYVKFIKNCFFRFITSKLLYYFLSILFLCFGVDKCYAQKYSFKGVYSVENVITSYCDDCFLNLPLEYLQSNFVLSVNTDNIKDLYKAIVSASNGIGWDLKQNGKNLIAEPIQNKGNLVFISCLTFEPKEVPKYLYSYAKKSDSLKCAKNDSLLLYESFKEDSLKKTNDSLANIRLSFLDYELKYYNFSKSFTDKIGVSWEEILLDGNLHNKFNVYDYWALVASASNDTSFNFRQINIKLDSTLNIDWGTEEQTLLNSFANDGVINNNYEWRKYGLIITITKDDKRIKLDYVFRDKNNSVSVLQGSAVALLGDTLKITGVYNSNREVNKGVPILSNIPVLKYLFAVNQTISDLRSFELYLIPKEYVYKTSDSVE